MMQDASNSDIHSYICGEMPILNNNTGGVEERGLPSSSRKAGLRWRSIGDRQKEKAFHSLRSFGSLFFHFAYESKLSTQ
jgi:hypothetical protein